MYALSDRGIFNAEAVEKILNGGSDSEHVDGASGLRIDKESNSGVIQDNTQADNDRFEILECYVKIDENNDGMDENLIIWVHTKSKEILRATYLERVLEGGQTPFSKIDFLKKRGHMYGMGVPEILYALQKEVDAMHNIRIDYGILSTMPFGFYRATSGLDTSRIDLEPGKLIPVNDPQGDVFFPQLGNRTFFTESEEGSLHAYIERLISISDINLGRIGGQGAARTATGVSALVAESNANLDIFIKRMQRGWKKFLRVLFQNLQKRMPKDMWIRITGEDGKMYPFRISREDIKFSYDFDIDANSANSNKAITREIAQQTLNLCLNPLLIQMGVVTPDNLYEAVKEWLVSMEKKDFARFITKPTDLDIFFTPEQEVQRIIKNIPVPVHPAMNHEGFINYVRMVFDNDQMIGTIDQEAAKRLAEQASAHMEMMQAMEAQAAQVRNMQQQQTKMEKWLKIKGYDNGYEVSDQGNVRRGKRKLKPYKTRCGYVLVRLYNKAVPKEWSVHRLVYTVFKNKINPKLEINHIDGNKENNKLINLEEVTRSENLKHSYKIGKHKPKQGTAHKRHKLKDSDIIKIRSLLGYTQRQIASMFNVSQPLIGNILRRETWKHI
jgi:hypothetical protein